MQTEVVTKTNTNTQTAIYKPAPSGIVSTDLVIPELKLMQGLSDMVAERRAIMGDMVRSTNAEKLGDDKAPIDIIPLTIQSRWIVSENANGDGKSFDFRRYEPRNVELPWDFEENGTKWKRTKVLTLFCLLPKDVDAYQTMLAEAEAGGDLDVDKVLLPVAIHFKGTGFAAGRSIATLFTKAESLAQQLGRPVPVYGSLMKLSCVQEKNDKGNFFVFNAESNGKTPEKYKKAAESWYKTLSTMSNIKVDDTDTGEITF